MKIRRATSADINELMPIFEEARKTIAALGIDQWQNGYPDESVIGEDISLERSYLVESCGRVVASFAVITDGEPDYDKIYEGEWHSGNENKNYVAIHRVAICTSMRGRGIASEIIEFVKSTARACGKLSLRIDTHRGNIVMRRMLEKNGFSYSGIIYLKDGAERVAYELLL